MPLYDYKSDDGERIEVMRSMRDEHPETIEQDGKVFRRVYTVPQPPIIRDAGGVRHKGQALPISQTLLERDTREGTPVTEHGQEVVKYPDGSLTDKSGAWIIRDNNDARRAEELTGTKRER